MNRSPNADAEASPPWQVFVLEHGWRVPAHLLAAVLGQPDTAIRRFRSRSECVRRSAPLGFSELFSLWHGRAPEAMEWPAPHKSTAGVYEWLKVEEVFLAGLVGQLGIAEIVQAINARLQHVTGDSLASRTQQSVQQRINVLGLQLNADVLGGITVACAAQQVGSSAVVRQAIRDGHLRTRKVGRVLVIPHEQWSAWKARRHAPPEGKVKLSSLREQLGIRSDSKLPEFAKLGYIPTAELHASDDVKGRGEWYVTAEVARTLLADRSAGRRMPWHGKPLKDNLKVTHRLWRERQHPAHCETCRQIWGDAGAPVSFEDYVLRYPPLAHGAKRHLTRIWEPGLTEEQVARHAGCELAQVQRALDNGALSFSVIDGVRRVTQTAATLWVQRKCADGTGQRSWLSLDTAEKQYGFLREDLEQFMADGRLKHKFGTDGAMRGITYVLKHQCAQLRHTLGFTIDEAARRAGVTPARMLELLKGVNWRSAGDGNRGRPSGAARGEPQQGDAVPLLTLQAVIKRLGSAEGHTIEEAAIALGIRAAEIRALVEEGTLKLIRTPWNPERAFLTDRMMKRLQDVRFVGSKRVHRPGDNWLLLSDAARLAGVTTSTILAWYEQGDLNRTRSARGWRYQEASVKSRARRYWPTVRNRRAVPPDWLQQESLAQRACEAASRAQVVAGGHSGGRGTTHNYEAMSTA